MTNLNQNRITILEQRNEEDDLRTEHTTTIANIERDTADYHTIYGTTDSDGTLFYITLDHSAMELIASHVDDEPIDGIQATKQYANLQNFQDTEVQHDLITNLGEYLTQFVMDSKRIELIAHPIALARINRNEWTMEDIVRNEETPDAQQYWNELANIHRTIALLAATKLARI